MIHEPNTSVSLSITHARSNQQDITPIVIDIQDRNSTRQIIKIELTAEEFVNVLQGMYLTVPAWVIERPQRDQIGMKYIHETNPIPAAVAPTYTGYDHSGKNPTFDTTAADAFASNIRDSEGWELYRLNHTNSGWTVTFMRWEEQVQEEAVGEAK